MIDYQGEKFQKKLADLGLSATEAAKRIGISRDTIHKWFKKERLDYKQVVRITNGLELSEEEIWGNPEDALREPTIEYGHPERQLNPVVDYRDELLKALLKNQELQNEIDSLREELNNIKNLHQRNGTA